MRLTSGPNTFYKNRNGNPYGPPPRPHLFPLQLSHINERYSHLCLDPQAQTYKLHPFDSNSHHLSPSSLSVCISGMAHPLIDLGKRFTQALDACLGPYGQGIPESWYLEHFQVLDSRRGVRWTYPLDLENLEAAQPERLPLLLTPTASSLVPKTTCSFTRRTH